MRMLFSLLALLALLAAPVGAPATATMPASEHCADMAGMDHDQPDPGAPSKDKSCCTAVVAALPPAGYLGQDEPGGALRPMIPLADQASCRGDVEIPPPRF